MSKPFAINSSMLDMSKTHRMDAGFWEKVVETAQKKNVSTEDAENMKLVVRAVEEELPDPFVDVSRLCSYLKESLSPVGRLDFESLPSEKGDVRLSASLVCHPKSRSAEGVPFSLEFETDATGVIRFECETFSPERFVRTYIGRFAEHLEETIRAYDADGVSPGESSGDLGSPL